MCLKYLFIFLLVSSTNLISGTYFDSLFIKTNDQELVQFQVEVVKTPKQQKHGLMYRKELKKNTGMLFIFKEEKEVSFWMKNTLISLDIIFINREGKIDSIKKNTEPKSLRRIKSENEVIAVLEINSGESDALGINKESKVEIQKFLDS